MQRLEDSVMSIKRVADSPNVIGKTMTETGTGTDRETVRSSNEGHRSSKIDREVMSQGPSLKARLRLYAPDSVSQAAPR